MSRLTPKQIEEMNLATLDKNSRDFKLFKELIEKGECMVCGLKLSDFSDGMPCPHWMLTPPGFRKKHFKLLFDEVTYDRLEGFLRWYVNAHVPFQGINDLKDEHNSNKARELTIKHGTLEWSFSFAKGCLEAEHGEHGPHYHFQMRINDKPFFNYGDRHIKLSPYELRLLDIDMGNDPDIRRVDIHGMGMEGAFNDIDPESLLEGLHKTEDASKSTFHVQTVMMADPGTTISSKDIDELFGEMKRTGKTFAQLSKRLKNVRSKIFIQPGEGVPLPAQRKGGRKRKPKSK